MDFRSTTRERFRECIYFASDKGHLHTTTSSHFQIAAPITAAIYLTSDKTAHVVSVGTVSRSHHACVVRTVGHSVNTNADNLLAVHIHPTHPQFRRLQAIGDSGVAPLEHTNFSSLRSIFAAACRGKLSLDDAAELFEEVVELTVQQLPQVPPAASSCSAFLAREQTQTGYLLRELADELGVCYERASRVFKEVTGTTLRSYRLWLKLREVQRALRSGKSLTDIAHELGFTDLAHMTRVHGRCFGYPPSRILRDDVLVIGPTNAT